MKPITAEEAIKVAKDVGAATYVECSSLTQAGLKNVFDEAVKTVFTKAAAGSGAKKKGCTIM